MLYFIQVILYTAMMLLIYLLVLRNRPHYQLSRCYLLASALIPPLLPMIQLPKVLQEHLQKNILLQVKLPDVFINATSERTGHTLQTQAGIIIYCGICILLLVWHTWHIANLFRVIKNSEKQVRNDYLLITGSGYGPGSFGRYIIFPDKEVNSLILAHEQAHVRLRHTVDLLVLNLLQAALWPNLLLIWIKKEMKQVHEFQADAQVLANREEYTSLLLSSVFNTQTFPAMHLFIIHPIKRRIMMLQKKGEGNLIKTSVKIAFALSVLITTGVIAQNSSKKPVKKSDETTKNEPGKQIHQHVDVMPQPGYNLSAFLGDNIVYPQYAKAKGIEGRVLVKFVVDEQGAVIHPEVIRSPDTSLSNEALRVINKLDKWKPGELKGQKVSVYYTLPIVFKLK